jgi:hypothetical protein
VVERRPPLKDQEAQDLVPVGLCEAVTAHKPLKLIVGLAEVVKQCGAEQGLL